MSPTVLSLLFGFRGRSGRGAYWLSSLGTLFCLGIVALGFVADLEDGDVNPIGAFFMGIAVVVCFWINLAFQVRRWHDRDKSAMWLLMNFVPYVGSLWVLVECGFLSGTPGPNTYDLDPDDRRDLDGLIRDEVTARVVRKDVERYRSAEPVRNPPAAAGWSAPAGWQSGRAQGGFGRRGR